jgi:hypothetical protein
MDGCSLTIKFFTVLKLIVKYVLNGGSYPYLAVAMLKESKMTLIGRFEGKSLNMIL